MEVVTRFGGKKYKHSEYTTKAKIDKLPEAVKNAIEKSKQIVLNNTIIEKTI